MAKALSLLSFCFLLMLLSSKPTFATWNLEQPNIPAFSVTKIFNAVVDGKIDNTCTTDVSEKITNWLVTIPDNSEVHFPEGCYMINGLPIVERDGEKYLGDAVSLIGKRNIVFSGVRSNGVIKTIFKVTRNVDLTNPDEVLPRSNHPSVRRSLIFNNVQGLIVRNLRIEGTNTQANTDKTPADFGQYRAEYEAEHAFRVLNSRQVIVEHVEVDAIWGDGLYVGENSEDVKILNSKVTRNGRQGLALTDGNRILIDNLRIESSSRGAIDIEPNLEHTNLKNVEVRNSYFRFHLAAFPVRRAYNLIYHNNTIDQRHRGGGFEIIVLGREDERLLNMKFNNNTLLSGTNGANQGGIVISNTDNIEISGNIAVVDPKTNLDKRVGAKLYNVGGDLVVTNNDFGGACFAYTTDKYSAPVLETNNKTNSTNCNSRDPKPTAFPIKPNAILRANISATGSVTPNLTMIGNPVKSGVCAPPNSQNNVYARNPWDLQVFNNKLYIGNGEATSGHGTTKVCSYSPSEKIFKAEYSINDLQIESFKVSGNTLIVPGLDPDGKFTKGNFYTFENNQWKRSTTDFSLYKVYDVDLHNSTWYAAVGRSEFDNNPKFLAYLPVGSSLWTQVPIEPDPTGELCCSRTLKLFKVNDVLYGSISPANIVRIDSPTNVSVLVPQTFFPDISNTKYEEYKIGLRRSVQLGSTLYYLGGYTIDDHQWYPHGLYSATNELDSKRIMFADSNNDWIEDDDRRIWDLLVSNNEVYVLTSKPSGANQQFVNSILKSKDGKNWTEVLHFTHTTFARSFEILDGKFYVGMGSYYNPVENKGLVFSASTGDILALDLTNTVNRDINGDGSVNVLDVFKIISDIFGNTTISTEDLNNDSRVDLLDIIALVGFII